ncbi:hypothetical protein L3i20_v245830 [Paenibacillus sp. L3-i20]|nr:hypothetical protein L3i20_v245830 [Paenibacillus sp. L3-i20]
MKLWEMIKSTFKTAEKKDVFNCAHCRKVSKGKWCQTEECRGKSSRGWYYDEYGHVCKPTAKIRPR